MDQEIEKIIKLVKDTYSNISIIKQDIDIFEASIPFKKNVLAIEIALALFELGYFTNRPIEKNEENWFEGGYYIHYDFDGKWPNLADNYSAIVEMTKQNNFFR